MDSSRAMGKWRAGLGRGSGLSLPGGGSSLQTANALACESPSISTNDAIREGGGGTRKPDRVSTNLHTRYTLPFSDTVVPSDTPVHALRRLVWPTHVRGYNCILCTNYKWLVICWRSRLTAGITAGGFRFWTSGTTETPNLRKIHDYSSYPRVSFPRALAGASPSAYATPDTPPTNPRLGEEPPPPAHPRETGPSMPQGPGSQGGRSSTPGPASCSSPPEPVHLPHAARPAALSSSRSRYPAAPAPLSDPAVGRCSPLPLLHSSSEGPGLGRAGAASAPLPRPGRPREEVPLSVSGEGRAGRPEGAVPRTGSGRELRGGGGGGGGGSGPYKQRGQGGREASVRPMCRPQGAGVGAAGAMHEGWAGGRLGAERSRLGA